MSRYSRFPLDTVLRLLLAWCVLFSPLSHAWLMAVSVAPQEQRAGVMPCHQQADDPEPALGDCCCKPGSPCHCAMALTLPASPLPMASPAPSARFSAHKPYHPHSGPPPDTPPPRT